MSTLEPECLALVTPLAVGEVGRPESALIVMARPAARAPRRGKMHRHERLRHLPAAGRTALHRVAAGAVHSSAKVLAMIEIDRGSARPVGISHGRPCWMACSAGAD